MLGQGALELDIYIRYSHQTRKYSQEALELDIYIWYPHQTRKYSQGALELDIYIWYPHQTRKYSAKPGLSQNQTQDLNCAKHQPVNVRIRTPPLSLLNHFCQYISPRKQ